MIRRVTVENFKRFHRQEFELNSPVVLAGPNNSGKSTLLQAIAMWKFGINRWVAYRERTRSKAVKRSGVIFSRAEVTAVPLREMNLLWQDRKISEKVDNTNVRRLIKINVEGCENGQEWQCGLEFQYHNSESAHIRPLHGKTLDQETIKQFPPAAAQNLSVVHVPPLSGIERDEERRERGAQDLLIGQGRPGQILRNLLWEISISEDKSGWDNLSQHINDLFEIKLSQPIYSISQPHILCEYREHNRSKPLDLSSAGSGMLQVLLLFAFLYARPATLILLDEPDAHQHPILQKQVYDMVKKIAQQRKGQVIVASHSEAIINNAEPTQVIGFGGTAPRTLTEKTQLKRLREALKRVTTMELVSAKNYNGVLYVEGESDEKILAEWAQILEHPARRWLKQLLVYRLGGNEFSVAKDHFFAMQAFYPSLRAVCLLDGDNLDSPDQKTNSSDLVVLRWSRYEIENYLLHPQAIMRFVDAPLFDVVIDQVFWERVPRGTDLFGPHVALGRVKASDEFLIPLLRDVGHNIFKRDLYQLASVMKQDEIHPEVTEKLNKIAEVLKLPT